MTLLHKNNHKMCQYSICSNMVKNFVYICFMYWCHSITHCYYSVLSGILDSSVHLKTNIFSIEFYFKIVASRRTNRIIRISLVVNQCVSFCFILSAKYADILFVYSRVDGNAAAAQRISSKIFLRVSHVSVFANNTYCRISETMANYII